MNFVRPLILIGVLSSLVVGPLGAKLDQDGNGISDIWSAQYPSAVDPNADSDGDGISNMAEAVAGTNPASASSYLSVAPHVDAAGNVVVQWPGVAGKRYQVETSVGLGSWTPIPAEYSGSGVDLSVVVVPAGNVAVRSGFWRVAVYDHDSDTDGLDDWEELQLGTSQTRADTDSDGLPDFWEAESGMDPLANDAKDDPDGDHASNLLEYLCGTDPENPSDGGALVFELYTPGAVRN